MNMMRYAEREGAGKDDYCVSWLADGKSFIVRNPDVFTRQIVPKFFKPTKFSSFTRKLYRWGFRQINRGIGPDDPIVFGNEYFDRNNEHLMSNMRSVTAAGTRKAEQSRSSFQGSGNKRGAYDMFGVSGVGGDMSMMMGGGGPPDKRGMMFDPRMAANGMMMAQQQHHPGMYGGGGPQGNMAMQNTMRGGAPPMMGGGDMMGMPGGGVGGLTPAQQQAFMQQQFMQQQQFMMMQAQQQQQQHSHLHHHQQQHPQQGSPPQQQQGSPASLQQQGNVPNSGGGGGSSGGNDGQYPNPQSTAEIVNAAIAALRYAN